MNKKIIISIAVVSMVVVIISVSLGVYFGVYFNPQTSEQTSEQTIEQNVIETSPSPVHTPGILDYIELIGSAQAMNNKIIYTNSTAPSGAPLNFLRSLLGNNELSTSFEVCTGSPILFTQEMIDIVLGVLGNLEFVNNEDGLLVIGEINDTQIKQIIFNMSSLLGSESYVFAFIIYYTDGALTFKIQVVDTRVDTRVDTINKVTYVDTDTTKYNVVIGGYSYALNRYNNICKDI